MDRDAEHLKLLSIFHFVVGGLCALFASIFIVHIIMGLVIVNTPSAFGGPNGQQGPPAAFGWIFVILGTLAVGFDWLIAGLMMGAGYFLGRRKHPMFCLVVAGISCLFMPFGTVLGVFTIIVLQRPRVREMFGQSPP